MSADVQRLLNARRAILEAAERKLAVLRGVLSREDRTSVSHTLIYTTIKTRGRFVK